MNVTMMQKKTNWMSVQTMEVVKKKREAKAKKDTNLKKEINQKFQIVARKAKKQYYNNSICTYSEKWKQLCKNKEVFQKILELKMRF